MSNDQAYQAIGAYICAYSDATYELGETLKVLFRIRDNDMADAIVVALGDFARQAGLVWALCKDARNADGSELSEQQTQRIEETVKRCFACNDDRVKLAHGSLEPHSDGSVSVVHLKVAGGEVKGREGETWSQANFKARTEKLAKLADELRTLQKELQTITIKIPERGLLDWMSSYPNSLHRNQMSADLMTAISLPPEENK